ncbi:hypothetical protein [Halorubrum amylolyticum]|uniref:hypothetical protein n=1 Tax=Halorubrum amylolyticum TaxID=2508724 RepID=UPI001008CEA7|nr:hypothetical protein [Halorubrum amylolyticum]
MSLDTSAVAFRILEIVSILLPLVLVLLQVSIQYYRDESVETRPVEQGVIFISIGLAGVVLVSAGFSAIDILTQQDYATLITDTLTLVQSALFLLILPLSFIVLGAITDIARETDFTAIRLSRNPNQKGSHTEQVSNTPSTDDETKESEESEHEQ